LNIPGCRSLAAIDVLGQLSTADHVDVVLFDDDGWQAGR
jgi:hypothetical protein